jgi:hypothetical protein
MGSAHLPAATRHRVCRTATRLAPIRGGLRLAGSCHRGQPDNRFGPQTGGRCGVGRFFLVQDRHVGSKSSLRNCGSEDIIACRPDPGALRAGVGIRILDRAAYLADRQAGLTTGGPARSLRRTRPGSPHRRPLGPEMVSIR